ncbi:16S rRNA (guanine(527)-N(7))-methyltransferase RsmG [Blastochloris viridis]|nr:16S rRNA (guanine(527)-N(7))-methyltransferase RsmG [Blastochloris viridis]
MTRQFKPVRRDADVDLDAALADDRARALAIVPVSREIAERLDRFVALLRKWQPAQNLVAASTLPTLWTRHIADSLQLADSLPGDSVVDLGSGAGFPGLVLAVALAERPGARVHLVESNQRKAAFLREAARVTGAPATVHAARIEAVLAAIPTPVAAVTARALAPLADLVALSYPLLKSGAVGLFLKGQDVERELTETSKSWTLEVVTTPSHTDPGGRIVRVNRAEPRAPSSSSGS